MRDGLGAGDRVQLHINNGKKKAYTRNGLDWIKRFPVGRSAAFCQGRSGLLLGTPRTCQLLWRMSALRGKTDMTPTARPFAEGLRPVRNRSPRCEDGVRRHRIKTHQRGYTSH